jgi:alpha-galactosidase
MNRRSFCSSVLAASAGAALGGPAAKSFGLVRGSVEPAMPSSSGIPRFPDSVTVFHEGGETRLEKSSEGVWQAPDIEVRTLAGPKGLLVSLLAPKEAVTRIRLRWREDLGRARLFLGDHWERSYGDLEWRGEAPNRVLPWYFLAWDGTRTNGWGVATAPAALCFWNADRSGFSLWADVRCGGAGVLLGNRSLPVCEVRFRPGKDGESPFTAARAFCRNLCDRPLPLEAPVFGTNDWYYSYGDSRPESILETTGLIVSLSPAGPIRPWSVIDDGWSPGGTESGRWDRANERFIDMARFAEKIRAAGANPGIWFRPLLADSRRPESLRLARARAYLDPSLPDTLAIVAEDTRRFRDWGYHLIKHDYTTFDVFGKWGFAMGATPADDGWRFADRTRTTAEIILGLYRALRDAAGESILIGCNTLSHLSAGVFEINRIGDDVSGRSWDRTRRMGVNTLAFRAAHHGAFYAADPDIAPITRQHPWAKGRQWLDLLAGSGMPLFVSPEIEAVDGEVKEAIRRAFAEAASPQPVAEPLDWLETVCPRKWRLGGRVVEFDWADPDGPWPFRD